MPTTITLQVFSGRPNPEWTLTEEQAQEWRRRVSSVPTAGSQKPAAPGRLGYRGFTVEEEATAGTYRILDGAVESRGVRSPSDPARSLERWLLSTCPLKLSPSVIGHVSERIKGSEALLERVGRPAVCPACVAADAPAYNPGAWNIPAVQPHNNCYNYANNQITNTFAQPGRGTQHEWAEPASCATVQPAAVSDGLAAAANFSTALAAGHGWYVALVIWPDEDFHWYRQDSGGCWSHKPGESPVVNTDSAGDPIEDPEHCDRGPYTVFCSFMITTANAQIN